MADIITGNRDTVIRTMLAEAAGEGATGLLAVAATMGNRARQTGLTLEQISTQPGQFEPHMNQAGRDRMARYRPGNALWNAAEQALDRAMGGEDPTGGADHFYAPIAQRQATDGRDATPRWAVGQKGTRIGGHVFYNLGYGNRRTARAGGQVSLPGTSVPATPSSPPVDASAALTRQANGPRGTLTGAQILGGALPTPVVNTAARVEVSPKTAWAMAMEQQAGPMVDRRIENTDNRNIAEQMQITQGAEDRRLDDISGLDKFADSVRMNTPLGAAMEWLRDTNERGALNDDPNFNYEAKIDEYEEGRSLRQVDELRLNANSEAEVIRIRATQDNDTRMQSDIGGGMEGFVYNAGGSLLDPVGLVAGIATGGTMAAAGVGSRVYAINGARGAMVGSIAAEGAIGNALTTAAMQAAGTYTTPGDYVSALAFGAVLNQVSVPFVSREGNRIARERGVNDIPAMATAARDAAANAEIEVLATVQARLGPDATPEQIAVAAHEEHVAQAAAPLINTMNPIPEQNRFTSPNHVPDPTRDAEFALRLDNVADANQAGLLRQMIERADNIDRVNEHTGPDDALEKVWTWLPRIATSGLTTLRSDSALVRAFSKIFAEGASGHSGRRHSASIDAHLNERAFMAPMRSWEANLNLFRKEQGVSIGTRYTDGGEFDRVFNERVATEMRNRARPDLYAPDDSPAVRRAADMSGELYTMAGEAQVKWGTIGSQNITPGDKSYFQQSIDPVKLLKINQDNSKLLQEYRLLYAEQARTIMGYDAKFADDFSKMYMTTALNKATGGYSVPTNLSHHSAGDIVMETLTNMRATAQGAKASRLDAEIAKFARGGASFTKGRINWDVSHKYKSKVTGENISLLDLASTDMLGLARSYARRAAGEIALHKAGIEGKHGADLLREAVALEVRAGKATQKELDAVDQILSELLGTQFSKAVRVPPLQNLNMITSAIKLGGMAITQFGESTNAMAAIGVQRTLVMVPNMKRLIGEVSSMRKGETIENGQLTSLEKYSGVQFGMESYDLDRAMDIKDDSIQMYGHETVGIISRLSRGAAHVNAIYSGQRIMTAIQTRYMAEEIVAKAMTFIRKGKEDRALTDMGFTPALRDRIKANMDSISTVQGGKTVLTDIRAGDLTPAEISELVGVVHRGASQIIQKAYIGETGVWAHDDVLKSLFQFRTFGLTAVEKQYGRNIRTMGHVKALATLVGVTSVVAPIQIARTYAKAIGMDDAEREEFLEKNLSPAMIAQASLNYASAAGLLGDLWGVGGSATSNIMGEAAPEWLSASINPRGSTRPQQLLGGALMPSASILQDTFELANGNVSKLRSLLPGSNMPVIVPALNVAEGAFKEDDQ